MKTLKVIGIVVVSAIAYIVGLAVMGALSPALHIPAVKPITTVSPSAAILLSVLSSPLLILGLIPLAAGLKGTWLQRCSAIAVLLYVTLGLNTLLELKSFSTLLDGNPWMASLFWVLPSVLTAAVLAYGFGASQAGTSALGSFSYGGWAWRLGVAWLAFPVIYWTFGMCVAPIVLPYYSASNALGLHVPPMNEVIRTVMLRSVTFLLASFPAIAIWAKSRGRLIFALGLAHAMTVGVFPLAQAVFFPPVIRIAHGIEITCDSFVYALVLALLFARPSKAAQPVLSETHAAA